MTRLVWDPDTRIPTGLDRGVLYSSEGVGHAWSGLVSVLEAPDRTEITSYFLEGVPVARDINRGVYNGGVTAYHYPEILNFPERETFGLSYRVYNDVELNSYSLHVIYNIAFEPSPKNYTTRESSVAISTFDWKISTQPEKFSGYYPTAHFVFDTSKAHPWMIEAIEKVLYGDSENDARLPPINELIELFEHYSILKITDLSDGRFTAEGPDNVVIPDGVGGFTINWMSVDTHPGSIYTTYSA